MAANLGNAIGVVGGYLKYREGKKMAQDAQQKIDSFKWKDLNNPFRTQKVSTLGSDLQREENQKLNATAVQAMRSSGTRGVIGGVQSLVEGSNNVNRKIAADLDEQQKNIDTMASQDDTNIRAMNEKRQSDELAGYGQQLNIGRQEKYGGIADLTNAASSIGQNLSSLKKGSSGGMGGSAMGSGYNDSESYKAQYYGQRNA